MGFKLNELETAVGVMGGDGAVLNGMGNSD